MLVNAQRPGPHLGLLNWRAEDLAREAALGLATIRRAEVAESGTSMTAANDLAVRRDHRSRSGRGGNCAATTGPQPSSGRRTAGRGGSRGLAGPAPDRGQ